jgi:hypothetical protein
MIFTQKVSNNNLHQPTQFLYLTTNGRKTTRQHTIEIWFIEYNKKYYILSERKKLQTGSKISLLIQKCPSM